MSTKYQAQAVGSHNAECVVLRIADRTFAVVQMRDTLRFQLLDVTNPDPARPLLVAEGEYTQLAGAVARLLTSTN